MGRWIDAARISTNCQFPSSSSGRQLCQLNCSNQQAWESGQRSGEEEAGSALDHGELFRPRQAHEQSRQTVSPTLLLCRLQFPSSSLASFDPRATPIAVTPVFFPFRMGISFRLGRQIELSGHVVNRIRSHQFVILSPIGSSFRVDVS